MRAKSFPTAPVQMQMCYNESYPYHQTLPYPTTIIQSISSNICMNKNMHEYDCNTKDVTSKMGMEMNMGSDQYVQNEDQLHFDYVQKQQQKMSKMNINLPASKPNKLAVVIFDWDDSLYPTTALLKTRHNNKKTSNNNNHQSNNKHFDNVSIAELKEFGETLYETFQTYIKLFGANNIYIITNGSTEWVLKSLIDSSLYYKQEMNKEDKDYFIALYNLFLELNISIISGKRLFGVQFPKKPMLWKSKTFCEIAERSFDIKSSSNNIRNTYILISIGDSDNEYIAAREARCLLKEQNKYYQQNNIIRLHRVKLKKKPSINDIIKQLRFLMIEASNMNQEQGSIDIQFR